MAGAMDPEYDFEVAVDAFAEGRYEWLLSYALPFAERGDANAQCAVAALYQFGKGLTQDGATAVYWYEKAAAQNNGLAWNNLGTIYAGGSAGILPDRLAAKRCYEKAHALGFNRMSLDDFPDSEEIAPANLFAEGQRAVLLLPLAYNA